MSRILCLNYEYPPLGGGGGNATANLAREMARLGATVRVVTSAFGALPKLHETQGFTIRRIPTMRRREEKCAIWEMAMFMASACLYLPGIVREFKPDAIIAFFGIPCGPPAWLARRLTGTPYVVFLGGGDVPGFQPYDMARLHRLFGPAIRFVWKRAKAVVPNSQGLAALARAFEPGLTYPIIPHGADTTLFAPREAPRAPGPARFFFHGRLVFQKGLDVGFRALAMLPNQLAWEFHLAGDGPQRAALETQAHELGLADRIFFRGWMSRPDLAKLMQDMDAYFFPSRDEGMPNSVLEAMASGLAVATTRIAGCEELVIPGVNGFLAPPDAPEPLAEALAKLITDENLRDLMGKASRLRVLDEYSWTNAAARYLELCAGKDRT